MLTIYYDRFRETCNNIFKSLIFFLLSFLFLFLVSIFSKIKKHSFFLETVIRAPFSRHSFIVRSSSARRPRVVRIVCVSSARRPHCPRAVRASSAHRTLYYMSQKVGLTMIGLTKNCYSKFTDCPSIVNLCSGKLDLL